MRYDWVMAVHPNSLANLAPPFASGPDNPQWERTSIGSSIIKGMNQMSSWPQERIRALADDESAPINKRLAAKSLVRSMSDDWAKNGKPHAADDLDRVLDRTDGRAVQRVQVNTVETKDPDALRLELLALVAAHPALLDSLRALGVGAVLGEGGGAPNPDAVSE